MDPSALCGPTQVCEKAVQWTQAIALFLQLIVQQLPPDIITYNAVLSACQKSAQWQRAVSLFVEAQQHELQPTIITCDSDLTPLFNSLIKKCKKHDF